MPLRVQPLSLLIFRTIEPLQNYLLRQKEQGQTVGFVPTMGALHAGHISLLEQAAKENDLTVASIFVNPTQFNDKTDLDKYPVTIEADIEKLTAAGVDILLLPGEKEIYPTEASRKMDYDLGYLNLALEAAARPGHFDGVAVVVKRLLEIVKPDKIYMGQKDFQQCLVVRKLVADFKIAVEVIRSPIVREADGLAMSSRNVRLNGEHRKAATLISQTLFSIKDRAANKPLPQVITNCIEELNGHPLIDVAYMEAIDGSTLKPVNSLTEVPEVAVVAAARIGGVHLLDNVIIS